MSNRDEELNVNVARFFYILKNYDELLRDGYTNQNKLSVFAQVFQPLDARNWSQARSL